MKLISCYIENFGNLSKQSFEFNDSITSFYQENGTGKSTLANFIKAMFYGLETYKSSTTVFVDRMHYYPFNGQLFGGNLTFENNGKTYMIERFFDEKSAVKDTFKLYLNGSESDDYSNNVGEELFGINKSSFERLLFINDEDIEIKTNSSINAKLNTLLEGRDDTDLESVLQILEKKSKLYKDSKSQNSLTYLRKEEAKKLKIDLINNNKILETLESKYTELELINKELNILKNKQSEVLKQKEYEAKLETYNVYLNDIKDNETKLNELKIKYPNGLLSKTDLDLLKINVAERKNNELAINNNKLSLSQQYEYDHLSKKYENCVEDSEIINNISNDIKSFDEISNEIDNLNNITVDDEDLLINKRFSLAMPSEEEVIKIDEEIASINQDNNIYQNMDNFKTVEVSKVSSTNNSNKLYMILAIICGVLLIVGIAMIFLQLILGIILVSVSIVGLLVTGFIYLNKKQSLNTNTQVETIVNQDKINLKNIIEAKELYVKAFFNRYGYTTDLNIELLMFSLKEDLRKYNKFKEEQVNNKNKLQQLINNKEKLSIKLDEFFNKYQIKELSYQQALLKYKEELSTYFMFNKLLSDEQTEKKEVITKLSKNNQVIESICQKYQLQVSNIDSKLEEITLDCNNYLSLANLLVELVDKANTYKANNNIKEEKVEVVESLDEIKKAIDELEEKKVVLIKQISDDEFKVSTIYEDENKLINLENEIKEYKVKYDIFEKTISALKDAEQNLKNKYIGPVKNKFLEYATLIEVAIGEKIEMSKDFEIYYERNGKYRSEKHLSSGLRSICALCFRLSLLDNMFKDEKPFIILDDPFLSLDDNHISKVKEIIKVISSNIQILYFTCHESRKL